MTDDRIARDGDKVLVHYLGRLDNGDTFDTSRDRAPLEFTLGGGSVIPGFERAVKGLKVGGHCTVRLEPSDAYGERNSSLIGTVAREKGPSDLSVGDEVKVAETHAVVVGITDDELTLDANHPLAGEALTFEIELVGLA